MAWALVDDGLRFSVHRMVGKVIAGGATGFSGVWTWTRNGERRATIRFAVAVHSEASATLTLDYTADGEAVSYAIRLVGKPCRFGGRQWFAICPHTGLTVAKLYKPYGATKFLARKTWRLAYRSQRDSAGMDRAMRRRDRILVNKLKSDDPDFPLKPKWMRWKTFNKWHDKMDEAETDFDRAFMARFGVIPEGWR